jgi:hypothetical protein
MQIICLACAKPFEGTVQRCCSKACSETMKQAWFKRHSAETARARAAVRGSLQCERCGAEFVPIRATARFCSVKCRVAAHRNDAHVQPWRRRRPQGRVRRGQDTGSRHTSRPAARLGAGRRAHDLECRARRTAVRNHHRAVAGGAEDRGHSRGAVGRLRRPRDCRRARMGRTRENPASLLDRRRRLWGHLLLRHRVILATA